MSFDTIMTNALINVLTNVTTTATAPTVACY